MVSLAKENDLTKIYFFNEQFYDDHSLIFYNNE